jgi:hypothetical protein
MITFSIAIEIKAHVFREFPKFIDERNKNTVENTRTRYFKADTTLITAHSGRLKRLIMGQRNS